MLIALLTDVAFANVAGEIGFGFPQTIRLRDELKKAVKSLLAASGLIFLEVM